MTKTQLDCSVGYTTYSTKTETTVNLRISDSRSRQVIVEIDFPLDQWALLLGSRHIEVEGKVIAAPNIGKTRKFWEITFPTDKYPNTDFDIIEYTRSRLIERVGSEEAYTYEPTIF